MAAVDILSILESSSYPKSRNFGAGPSHDWQIVEWYSRTVEALVILEKMDRGEVMRVPDDRMDDKEGEGVPTDF